MSERIKTPNPFPASAPSAPVPPPRTPTTEVLAATLTQLPTPPSYTEEAARARIATLEREAKARGADPVCAELYHQMGLLWEDPLRNPRNAAVAYQNAYRLNPRLVSNLRAARRLFSEVGNWQMALQLLEAEASASTDPRTQAGLAFEKATLLEERLGRLDDALVAYRACLSLSPKDVALLVQLESVFAAKNDVASLVEVYRQLAGCLEEATAKAQYLTAAGVLYDDRLNQPAAAAEAFRAAFALDRKDVTLLSAMKRVAERDGNSDELLAALAAEAELLGPSAAPTYLQIGKLYERLGRREDALSALLSARRVSPQDPLVLSGLATIYEAEGRHEDLADVLLSWVGAISDEGELIAINLRLAALYEETLKRDDDAVARYRAILERVPGHAASLAALGKLYFRQKNWEQLMAVFEAEASAAEDPRQKATKLYKAAEICEERLARAEDAISRYAQCLQLQPGFLPAQKSLTRLYEKQGRFAELVALFEQDVLQTADRDQIIATLHKMAAIYEDRLNDLDRAIDCMKRVLEIAHDHLPTLHNLSRIYERAQRWTELLDCLDVQASLVGETKQVISIRHRSAEVLEEQVKDRAGAIGAYERLLSLSPSYLPALRSLGRLYAQDGRWHDLIRMYRAEAEISPSPEHAASLIAKIGELFEQKLNDQNEAIASYQEVLTLAPNHFPALRALARIYRAHQAWESLVEVLRSEAANRTDPVERANALFQAAAIWEDRLERPDLAIEGYHEVLRLNPGHGAAIHALERLYLHGDQLKELIAILDRQTQTGSTGQLKVLAYLKLARLYLDRMSEPARAAQCAEAALAIEPEHVSALKLLDRIRSADRARRAELKQKLAERVVDVKLKGALKLAAAMDQDVASARIAELNRAHADEPGDARLSFALERSLRQANDFQGLVVLYGRRLSAASAPEEKLELSLRLGELCEHKLGQLDAAAEHYARAIELRPDFLPALQGARRIAVLLDDAAGARGAYEREGQATRDAKTAIEAFVHAGRICLEQLNDPEGAVTCFRQALERDPLDPSASAALEELLAARGGAVDLAGLHERRAEAKLAQKDHATAASEFYFTARIYLDELKQRTNAIAMLQRALEAQPNHPDSLEHMGELALEDERWADAAQSLSRRVQQGGEARVLSRLHLTLGGLYQDHLGDPSRAAAHLQTALAGDPRNVGALARLAQLHTDSRNWTGAADCLRRLIEMVQEPVALAHHLSALAQITDEGFGDAKEASALYRRALELSPQDTQVLDRLVALYERTGNLPELVGALEQQARHEKDTARRLSLQMKIGALYAGPVGDAARAIACYRQATELDPAHLPAQVALADLLARDPQTLSQAIEAHRAALRVDPARVDSLHALFKAWDGQRAHDKAFCVAAVLHFLKSADEAEAAYYNEWARKLPGDPVRPLGESEIDALMHPDARGAVLEVLRTIGDQLSRIYPPNLEALGVDRKADRLKPDHAVHKAVRSAANAFAIAEFEVYQAKRGLVTLETSEPLAVCVGESVVKKFNAREQRFLLGRAALGLFNRTAVLAKLSTGESADLIGNSVRIHAPNFTSLGRKNDEMTKQLRKAYSRKALKALEAPANALAGARQIDLGRVLGAVNLSGDRAGLLLSGDPSVALSVVMRDDAAFAKLENAEGLAQALRGREDLKALLSFALSEEFFKLRQKAALGLSQT
jgi:tetratricopeptide (TPR) repeat protein